MALGAELVADDAVILTSKEGAVWVSAPDALLGRIEAHGIGILRAEAKTRSALALVVDLDRAPEGRLPAPLEAKYLGQTFPLLAGRDVHGLVHAILAILKGGLERHT